MCCKKTTNGHQHLLWLATVLFSFILAGASQTISAQPATRDSEIKIDGTVVLFQGRPMFAKVIQHNGEQFSFLRSLGFNAIQLPACATPGQLEEARSSGIWLICPPPSSVGLQPITFDFDPVIAWSVADQASARHAQVIRESIREVQESDRRAGRPVIAGVSTHWDTIGRMVDISVIGSPTIGSSFNTKDYSDWIAERAHSQNKPYWIDVPTHAMRGFQSQVGALAGSSPPLPIEHQQMKTLLYEAISGGGRGLRFLSNARLDGSDPSTLLRVLTLRWLMQHIDQIKPWASGGLAQKKTAGDSADPETHLLKMAGSSLLMVQRPTGIEQITAGDQPLKRIELSEVSNSVSDQVYIVNENGASLISNQRAISAAKVRFDSCPYAAMALVTQDPQLVAHVNRFSATGNSTGTDALELHIQLSSQWLGLLQLTEQQLAAGGNTFPFVAGAVQEATQHLRNAERMLTRGNRDETLLNLEQADAKMAFARRRLIETHGGDPNGIVSSPLLMNSGLINEHLQLSGRLVDSSWNPNSLTGGDFENLEQMLDSGWINRREDFPDLVSSVTLSKKAAADGVYGLRMSVDSGGISKTTVQAPPVWIKSAPVVVKAGQLVRIHGFINVPEQIGGSHDGLLITESLGGSDLASRVQKTNGWQEFTLYRGVEKAGNVSVTFALTGYGQAMIDEITIRTIDFSVPATQANSAAAANLRIK